MIKELFDSDAIDDFTSSFTKAYEEYRRLVNINQIIVTKIEEEFEDNSNIYISLGPAERLEFIVPPFIVDDVVKSDKKYHIFVIDSCGWVGCIDKIDNQLIKFLDRLGDKRELINITWMDVAIDQYTLQNFFETLETRLDLIDNIIPVYWGVHECGVLKKIEIYLKQFLDQ
jgi:hypothetical protein